MSLKSRYKIVPSSLISRFAAVTAILATAIIIISYFSFHAMRGDIFRDSFETPLEEWGATMAAQIKNDPEIARRTAMNHKMGVAIIIDGEVHAFGPDGEPISQDLLVGEHAVDRTINVQNHSGTSYYFYLRHNDIAGNSRSSLWSLIAGLLFVVGVVYVVQLSQLRPLRWLKEGVEQVAEGNVSVRVPVIRLDEIGKVGRAFNHMTERVEQMLDDQDRLLADVSHELRSPLARVKLALELMPEGEKRDLIARDIREMEALTSALLERERIKNRAAQHFNETFDLSSLARDVAIRLDGNGPGLDLTAIPDGLNIRGDKAMIKILLQNLLDNGLKFSLEDSGPVQLRLTQDADGTTISVSDDGCGIPNDETERVLEPFVKLDPARGHHSGYGLGLNLCHRIVQAHRGTIAFEANPVRGTTVTVTLPSGRATNQARDVS